MRKILSFLLPVFLLLVTTDVWGTDVTFTFNTDAGIAQLGITKPSIGEGTSLSTTDPYTLSGVSMMATHGSTDTRVWNSSGTLDLRIYKSGGSLSFSAPTSYNITNIVLAGTAVGNFSTTEGTFSAGSWSGSAASVTLTATNTGKINTITVTYTADDDRTEVNMTSFTATKNTLIVGETTTTTVTNDQDGWTEAYSYSTSDNKVATVDASGVITGVKKGSATITCSLVLNPSDASYKAGATTSKTISITVNKPSHTATFMVNGEQNSTLSVEEDQSITFPVIANQAGLKCMGWKTSTISGTSATEPDGMITSATMSTSDVTYHAVFARIASTTPASVVETALNAFGASDILVIIGRTSTKSYALPNNGGASAPAAVEITGGTLTPSNVSSQLEWNISGNASDGYTFYPNGSTTTWLYCINNNNGVRVGTGTDKTFEIKNGYLYNKGQERYLGVYVANPDWRSYTSNDGNIANQTFTFYKYTPESNTYDNYCTTLPMQKELSADTWASFCPSFDVTIPEDVNVYYGVLSGSTLTAHIVSSSKIKGGEGVLLKSSTAGTYSFFATTSASAIASNDLKGTTVDHEITSAELSENTFYVLANNGGIGFFRFEGTIPANKAYLQVNEPYTSAPSIRFVEEGEENTTNIENVDSADEVIKLIKNGQLYILRDGITYDMMGRIAK